MQHQPRQIAEPDTREAAVAVVMVGSEASTPDVLLIKRAERPDDPWSGQMAFPGGRREPDDVDLLATVRRETREETGIALRHDDLLGELNDFRPVGRGLPRLIVRPFVFLLETRPEVVVNEEVDLHLWVRFAELPAMAAFETVTVQGVELGVTAYRICGHVVWGLTERILNSFIGLCFKREDTPLLKSDGRKKFRGA